MSSISTVPIGSYYNRRVEEKARRNKAQVMQKSSKNRDSNLIYLKRLQIIVDALIVAGKKKKRSNVI